MDLPKIDVYVCVVINFSRKCGTNFQRKISLDYFRSFDSTSVALTSARIACFTCFLVKVPPTTLSGINQSFTKTRPNAATSEPEKNKHQYNQFIMDKVATTAVLLFVTTGWISEISICGI